MATEVVSRKAVADGKGFGQGEGGEACLLESLHVKVDDRGQIDDRQCLTETKSLLSYMGDVLQIDGGERCATSESPGANGFYLGGKNDFRQGRAPIKGIGGEAGYRGCDIREVAVCHGLPARHARQVHLGHSCIVERIAR